MPTARELFETGRAKFRDGAFGEAAEHFRQAAGIEPDTIDLWWHLGEACARDGQFDGMEAAYEKMIEIAHAHIGWAYFGRGRAREALGRPEPALEDFKSASQLGDDDFLWGYSVGSTRAYEVFERMAALHEKLGNLPDAIRSYETYQHYGGKPYNRDFTERHIRRLTDLLNRGTSPGSSTD